MVALADGELEPVPLPVGVPLGVGVTDGEAEGDDVLWWAHIG